MFIEIESKNKKAEIENIEFGTRQITFFLSDFFYLNFENEGEKEQFFSEFLDNAKDSSFDNGQSYVELNDSLIGECHSWNNVAIQDTTQLNVKSYRFLKHKNHLEIDFTSEKEEIKFGLYQSIINKILEKLK